MKGKVISNFFKRNSPMRQMRREFHTIYCFNFFGGGGKYFFPSTSHCLPFRKLSEMNKIYADFLRNLTSHPPIKRSLAQEDLKVAL